MNTLLQKKTKDANPKEEPVAIPNDGYEINMVFAIMGNGNRIMP
jgi:hypothetical protein